MIDLFFIQTFLHVVRTGSFRKAAEESHISQPAVSQQITLLEKRIGAVLLERKSRKIHLTDAGQAFLPYAEKIVGLYGEAKMTVGEVMNNFNGTIKVGTIYSIGLYELQPIIKKYLKKFPKIDIRLEYLHNNEIYQGVTNRTLDFGIVAFPRKKREIICETFLEDTLTLIQSHKNPVFKKSPIEFHQLHRIPFVTFTADTPTGTKINHLFRTQKISPKIIHAYDNIEVLKRAVEVGMGCALVPKSTIEHELKNKSLQVVNMHGELDFTRPLGILRPKGKTLNKSLFSFHEMITKNGSPK